MDEFSDFDLFLLGEFLNRATDGTDPYGQDGHWQKYDFDKFLTRPKAHVEKYCQEVTCACCSENDNAMTIYMLFIQYFQRY